MFPTLALPISAWCLRHWHCQLRWAWCFRHWQCQFRPDVSDTGIANSGLVFATLALPTQSGLLPTLALPTQSGLVFRTPTFPTRSWCFRHWHCQLRSGVSDTGIVISIGSGVSDTGNANSVGPGVSDTGIANFGLVFPTPTLST